MGGSQSTRRESLHAQEDHAEKPQADLYLVKYNSNKASDFILSLLSNQSLSERQQPLFICLSLQFSASHHETWLFRDAKTECLIVTGHSSRGQVLHTGQALLVHIIQPPEQACQQVAMNLLWSC